MCVCKIKLKFLAFISFFLVDASKPSRGWQRRTGNSLIPSKGIKKASQKSKINWNHHFPISLATEKTLLPYISTNLLTSNL